MDYRRKPQVSDDIEGKMLVVRVPKDRVGALIGVGGSVKKQIERNLGVAVDVDSTSGNVVITISENPDPSVLFRARDVITAIGRGFSPQKAFKLFDEPNFFKLIDLSSLIGKSPSDIRRIKGRLIGEGGKTRRIIEEITGCQLSIYGDTISIIGTVEDLAAAEEAVYMLVEGAVHGRVYRYLDEYAKKRKLRALLPEYEDKRLKTNPP